MTSENIDCFFKTRGKITNILCTNVGNKIYKIQIVTNKNKHYFFKAESSGFYGDTWINASVKSFDILIGKSIKSMHCEKSFRKYIDDFKVNKHDLYHLLLNDDTIFTFELINNSSEYYSGSIEIESSTIDKFYGEIDIVIGLPGSGKTSRFSNTFPFHDEILESYLPEVLYVDNGNLKTFADARLTDIKIFNKFIKILLKNVKNKKQIKLIIFENNPKQCIENIKNSDFTEGIKKLKINSINRFSPRYNTKYFESLGFKFEILKVFSGNK